jgi:hypothetical protein
MESGPSEQLLMARRLRAKVAQGYLLVSPPCSKPVSGQRSLHTEPLTVIATKIAVFWDMTPSSLADQFRRDVRMLCFPFLYHDGDR